jgi:hypothetical protein
MTHLTTLKWWLGIAAIWLASCPNANAAFLFSDDFQSDTAVLSSSTADADPVIGAGDIGGIWQPTESPALAVQVENDTVPGQNGQNGSLVAGANNYLRVYRGGGSGTRGAPYARNWNVADTLNMPVTLKMLVYQPTGSSLGVFFGTITPNTNVNAGVNNFANTAAVQVSLNTALPDNQWIPVTITANFSNTLTQNGLAPQTYKVIINNGTPTIGNFANAATQTPAILVGVSETNETFNYIDDVQIMTPEPTAACVWTVLVGMCGWLGWKKRKCMKFA